MRRRLALIVTATLALLVCAGPAQAAFFPAEQIDGPSPDIQYVGDLDVARDGTGALAYVRLDGGVPHVYVSRLVGGVFQRPERVDVGLDGPGGQPAVAASDGGRVVVVFVNSGTVFAAVSDAGAGNWTAPQPLAVGGSDPSVDMSVHGVAYATYTVGGNVLAARMERRTTQFTGIPGVLDVDPAREAGVGSARSRVSVGADGTAVAVWGEAGQVFARRLTRRGMSSVVVQASVGELEGQPGQAADLPDVSIEDDSSYAWIAFRQRFGGAAGGQARGIARRLRGSRLEDPVAVDGQPWGGLSIHSIDMYINGRGVGQALTATGGGVFAALIKDDIMNPGTPIGTAGPTAASAADETHDRVAAWIDDGGVAHARHYEDRVESRAVPAPGPDSLISNPGFGPVDPAGGFHVAADRVGDFAMAFIQGFGAERRVVAAVYDRNPGWFATTSNSSWRNPTRNALAWGSSTELWGGVTYTVEIDGRPVAQTRQTRLRLAPKAVRDGVHTWRVIATDRRGQAFATARRTLRIDTVAPRLRVSVKRKGRVATVTARANDVIPRGGRASGVAYARIDFGDRSGVVEKRRASHRYTRTGRFTIRVSATDKAGNSTVVRRTVRIGGR
jgi:hypothetical protein